MSLGAVESGRGGFVQDATGGIALYLDAVVVDAWPAGTTVRVDGEVASRFGQRTLRIAESHLLRGSGVGLPSALPIDTGAAGESFEGSRLAVSGTVTASPDALTDGLGVTIDDGSGPLRLVIGPAALDGRTIKTGMDVSAAGPLGQRDSSGTGIGGYRVHATLPGELGIIAPAPSPVPSVTPSPSPSANPSGTAPAPSPSPSASTTALPTVAPTPLPTSTATPTATPPAVSIAAARAASIGTRVTTAGVVIAEAGRVGSPSLIAIGDATGGLIVHGATDGAQYSRGTSLLVTGKLAAPYGQLEIKPGTTDVRVLGTSALPSVLPLDAHALGEADEGRLLTAEGRLDAKPTRSSSGDVTFTLVRDGEASVKVFADASAGVAATSLTVGTTYRVTGVVGQRASKSGALDGYRICLRDSADLVRVTAVAPTATPHGTPSPNATAPTSVSIAAALRIDDRDVRIEGTVTAPATLLDTTGRRVVVQDASAGVELLLPTGTAAPPVGTRVRATGRMGVAYGAPRLRADALDVIGTGSDPTPTVLHAVPGSAHEWRLVTISGRVASVHKLGDRWRAEITVSGKAAVVVGQPGAGVPSTALLEGRMASVTGIVRRPYPNATDRRFAITPRFPGDVRILGGGSNGNGPGSSTGPSATSGGTTNQSANGDPIASAADVDLDELDAHLGALVRVGGLVVELRPDGFTLDDGTTTGRIVLRGQAMDALPLIEPDDALNAIGRIETTADGPIVVVDDAGRLLLSGDPIAGSMLASPSTEPWSSSPWASPDAALRGRLAGLAGPPGGLDGGVAGIVTLIAISAASVVVTMLRRRHARRLLNARVVDRLAALVGATPALPAGPTEPESTARSAERGPSTLGSA